MRAFAYRPAIRTGFIGKLKIFDNPLGVMTNSPAFDWHMTNLRNYIALNPRNVPPVKIEGETFRALGQGSGMLWLPGDFSPPSRFVRAAVFSATAIPEKVTAESLRTGKTLVDSRVTSEAPARICRIEADTDRERPIKMAPIPGQLAGKGEQTCKICLFREKAKCCWYDRPIVREVALCGGVHWEAQPDGKAS